MARDTDKLYAEVEYKIPPKDDDSTIVQEYRGYTTLLDSGFVKLDDDDMIIPRENVNYIDTHQLPEHQQS